MLCDAEGDTLSAGDLVVAGDLLGRVAGFDGGQVLVAYQPHCGGYALAKVSPLQCMRKIEICEG